LKGNHSIRAVASGLAVLGLITFAACSGGGGGESAAGSSDELPPAAQPMSPEVQNLVNEGNEAQRAGEYEAALGFYRQAMEKAADHPVPQFGALMAAMALGEDALADSLAERLAVSAPDLLAMLNPDGSMGGMPQNPHAGGMPGMTPPPGTSGEVQGLPPGHPTLYEVTPDSAQPDTVVNR